LEDIINYVIYAVEGIIIQPMLIAGYIYVYKKQAEYNRALLGKYESHMTAKDAEDVAGANREACIYFSFICQFMLTYFAYSIMKIIFRATDSIMMSEDLEARMFDILSLVISVSNMLMLYGVSDSIKKSVDRQVRSERIVSTLDELISNSEGDESREH
jgi:hypothetical protein